MFYRAVQPAKTTNAQTLHVLLEPMSVGTLIMIADTALQGGYGAFTLLSCKNTPFPVAA